MRFVLMLVFLWVWPSDGSIEQIALPGLMEECFSRYSRKTNIVDTVGESIASFCFDQYMWRASRERGWKAFNISQEAFEWAHGLLKMTGRHRRQSVSARLRVRKEYRRLSEEERHNFHRAIQMLKLDTSVLPNRYDALSAIHQGIVTTSAHGGPNFLGFHRVYLLMFENALREKIPTVTLPYWDSTLDDPLMDPRQTVIFSDGFLGNGFGIVNSGPFAHWQTLSGPLIRNIGQSGQLFRREEIEVILSAVRLVQITEPNAPVNSSLEFLHNQVHLWTDGQMGSLNTAAHDPVFWVHHAYVDYVWELFRHNQRSFGIDPTTDYPVFVNDTMHLPGAHMGLGNFRNIEGLSDRFTSMYYTYEPAPACSQAFPDCGSPYLQCLVQNFRPTCVTLDRFQASAIMPMQSRFAPSPPMVNMAVQRQLRQQQATASARLQAQMALQQQMQQRQQIQQQVQQQRQMQQQQQIQQQQQFQQQMQQHNLQQQVLTSMNRQNAQRKEMENGVLDDANEAHQLQKRWVGQQQAQAAGAPLNNAGYRIQDQRGNSVQNDVNISAVVEQYKQAAMFQEIMNNLQNSTALPMQQSFADTCPSLPVSHGFQNTFTINGRSDINQWVYIPIKIIYQRPPKFTYTSYPVINGEAEEAADIYSPNSFTNIRTALKNGSPASYHKCSQQQPDAGKVFVASQGLNYMGTFKEYAIVDHRLAVSVSTTYVAIKSPEAAPSQVYLYAYDSCGRVCQPYCRIPNTSRFQRCTGAFLLTSKMPKLYGTNYGNAVMNFWQFSQSGGSPAMMEASVHVKFHCNFQESWPFPAHAGGPRAASTEMEAEEPEVEHVPRARPTSGTSSRMPAACHIGGGCIASGGCQRCQQGRVYACLGACSVFASCRQGSYHIHHCPENTWFDPDEELCRPGFCPSNRNQWWHQASADTDI